MATICQRDVVLAAIARALVDGVLARPGSLLAGPCEGRGAVPCGLIAMARIARSSPWCTLAEHRRLFPA